jgi:hypothetical protein
MRWVDAAGGAMDDQSRLSEQAVLEAVKRGGAAAAFEMLAKMGAAVEQAPEPGIGARVRAGAGTEDAFTSTQYLAAADRPQDWPAAGANGTSPRCRIWLPWPVCG